MKLREIIEHKVVQGSPEWEEQRTGCLTGSTFDDIMPAEKARVPWTKTQLDVLRKVASEILTGESCDMQFKTKPMEWGSEWEPIARECFSTEMMMNVRDCGIFEYSPMIKSSPDGIIANGSGVLEIKCPDKHTHLGYYLDPDSLWKKYKFQVIGEMLCTGIESGFLISFDPRFPDDKRMVVVEPPKGYRDDIKRLEDRLMDACALIATWIK